MTNPEPPPLPRKAPNPVWMALPWFAALAVLVFVAPTFEAMFSDFGAYLPLATQLCLDASFVIRYFWEPTVPLVFALAAYATYVVHKADRPRLRRAFLLSGVAALSLVVIALFLPIFYTGKVASMQ